VLRLPLGACEKESCDRASCDDDWRTNFQLSRVVGISIKHATGLASKVSLSGDQKGEAIFIVIRKSSLMTDNKNFSYDNKNSNFSYDNKNSTFLMTLKIRRQHLYRLDPKSTKPTIIQMQKTLQTICRAC